MTEEVKHSPRCEVSELPPTHKARFYPGQRVLWHLRHKIPGPGKFKIRWAGPYLIEQIYDNGSVDVTTLQGESLGRVNINKLKPYQELESTQAYALQILACHILEAAIRAEQKHLHKRNKTTQPQNTSSFRQNGETTLPMELTLYPNQETLESEDLEVHQIMLEGYWVQPSILVNDEWHIQSYEVNNPKQTQDKNSLRKGEPHPARTGRG